MSTRRRHHAIRRPARGAIAVEFAVVVTVLFGLVIGMVEVARLLSMWNAAAEATRFGARMGAMCGRAASDTIKARVAARIGIQPWSVRVNFSPNGCTQESCDTVTVELSGVTPETFVPWHWFRPSMPSFRTTLTREFLGSSDPLASAYLGGADNPACV